MKALTTKYIGARLPDDARPGALDTCSETRVLVEQEGASSVRELLPARSLKLRNHSPTGFAWGYCGSGPAQLALAILLDFTDQQQLAESLYQNFKFKHVAAWGDSWEITGTQIAAFIESERVRS